MSSLPTIKDVALLAGVSIGTVDRVVHNRGKVSERNMKAVQSAIDALGYRPSRIASALVKRRNDLKIGVCVPTVETEFWNNAIEGVRHAEEKLAPFGVSLVVETTSTYDFQDQKNCLLRLLAAGVNALILVPVQGEYYALEGLSDLMNTVRIVRRSLNPQLELDGVLLTMFDGRTNLALQVAEEVKHYFPGKVYATVIPRNVRLSEAPSHGKPITAYDRTSRGAEAYTAFAAEFLKKQSA